jgi:hypothetical protein
MEALSEHPRRTEMILMAVYHLLPQAGDTDTGKHHFYTQLTGSAS